MDAEMTSHEFRPEYRREDFGPMMRGKHVARLRESSNNIDQFTVGYGDYTAERDELFRDMTLNDMVADIEQRREQIDTQPPMRRMRSMLAIREQPPRCLEAWKMMREFSVVIEKDEDGYFVATVPALRGCHTQAKSLDTLMKRIKEAVELCLEVQEPVNNEFIGVQRVTVMA
jgi:predicted RNase H-like HicB family nuclease